MENLGKYFLELRQKRNINYRKINEELLVREELIRKIEDNRFFELGDYGVAKALVYNYARYLEADLEAVMSEFRIMMPETTKDKFQPHKMEKEKTIMLSTNFLWMVGIVIFVIILASILFHAQRQGWLKAPDFFKTPAADSTEVTLITPKATAKPDTLRTRMRALSNSIPASGQASSKPKDSKTVPADTTDYIGSILGNSPLNVPLH